jgi:hypothetical protein
MTLKITSINSVTNAACEVIDTIVSKHNSLDEAFDHSQNIPGYRGQSKIEIRNGDMVYTLDLFNGEYRPE